MTPKVSQDAAAHRFETTVEGEQATLDYTLDGATMTIAHIHVPEAIAHHGVAAALMRAALEAARSHGWRVVAHCPYAAFYLRQHLEWSDLVAAS